MAGADGKNSGRNAIANNTITIIGGGASGVLTAYHLAHRQVNAKAKTKIWVIDPRPELGLGLAYSTPSARHLLNVPAGKIGALPDEPDHFLNWLRANHDPAATAMTYAPRATFGRYLQFLFASVKGVEHVRANAVDVWPKQSEMVVKLENGDELPASAVVLATGNFDPAELPGVSAAAVAGGIYCHDAWRTETYRDLAPDARVALIGTGLTGVDVLLRLRETGHRGPVIAVSRHGVLPSRHEAYTPISESAIPAGIKPTCVAYLHTLRLAIRNGADWRAAVDSLRETTNDLWLGLPLNEQKRFQRHLQRRWDVVRHRMAPAIAEMIDAEIAAGMLMIREGHLESVDACESGARVTLRTRLGRECFDAARVINCTGPSMNYRRANSPLLRNLFTRGLAATGPLGSGFNCAPSGALIDAQGAASRMLFNVGPGRLGMLLESIAMPEIRQEAFELATLIGNCIEETMTLKSGEKTLARARYAAAKTAVATA